MNAGMQDWVLLAGRLLMTTVFFQSLHHHFGNYAGWIKALEGWKAPNPKFSAVLADIVIVVSVVLLITGWYPGFTVLLMIVFILFASAIGHRFWELQGQMRAIQYAIFTKNFSLIGGLVFYLAAGPGRFVVPRPW